MASAEKLYKDAKKALEKSEKALVLEKGGRDKEKLDSEDMLEMVKLENKQKALEEAKEEWDIEWSRHSNMGFLCCEFASRMLPKLTRLEPDQNQILSTLSRKLFEHHLKRQSEHEDIEILGNFKKGLQSKELPQELKEYHPDGEWMPPPLNSDEVKDMQGPMVTLLKDLAKHSQQHVLGKAIQLSHIHHASVFSSVQPQLLWSLVIWIIELKDNLSKLGNRKNGIGEVINRLELILEHQPSPEPGHLVYAQHVLPVSICLENNIRLTELEIIRHGYCRKAWVISGVVNCADIGINSTNNGTKVIVKYGCDAAMLKKEYEIVQYLQRQSEAIFGPPCGNPIVELGDGTTTLALFKDILTTLQTVHNYGVFHRDINPKNMVVVREGDRNLAYLIDWNIAILSTDTENDDFSCTPLYTSHNRLKTLLMGTPDKRSTYTYTLHDDLESLFWSLLDVLAQADVGHRLPWYRHLKKPSSLKDLCDSRYAIVYDDIE
ncbi:9893_t:CDS:2 [Paraglomus brasilianum]|uniref:9893_t:CDS:1 n=1 Tax=Paraglomus brasilianum TaxID=144538 RepID=A0A9N9GQX1_9GLOM|nr:9893_t:CDS:2 [Paraglomus brasilianum]